MGGRDGLADDLLSSSGGSGFSGGWGLLLGGLSSLLSGLLGGLGRGLALDGSTELGEWGLWLLALLITCGSLLFLVQPWEGALALVVLDNGNLSSLGLAIGGRGGGGLSWDGSRRSDAGGL